MPDLDEYVPVAHRISLFYERFPKGRIVTRLVARSADVIVVQASVYRTETERQPSATGLASERPGDGDVNTVACLENTETSAVGRALANLGFHATRRRPSYHGSSPASRDAVSKRESSVSPESLGVRTIYGPPARVRGRARALASDFATPPAPAVVGPPGEERRPLSVIARDLMRLLDEAEQLGVRPRRIAEWKVRVQTGSYADADFERLEAALRAWVCKARERRVVASGREM
jgi:hypothetical protein